MAELLRMPEVAAGSTAAVLSGWPVPEGASFQAGDALMIVETEKAEVDVPATVRGTLLKALVPEGTEVEVGSPIAVIAAPGEEVGDLAELLAKLGVVESGETKSAVRRDVPDSGPLAETAPSPDSAAAASEVRLFSSPLARRLAREAGISISTITGTGPGGRVVRNDVNAAIAARASQPTTAQAPTTAPAPASETAAPAPSSPVAVGSAAYEAIPHSRIRRAIAGRLTESKQSAPHFYLKGQVRAGALLALRQRINAEAGVKISVNDLLIKAIARAHVLVPEMNVIWTAEAVHRFHSVDVSVAVATEGGLVTPVLRDVDSLSLSAVSAQVRAFSEQARNGTLRQSDLEGGSITISNLGMYGVEEFSAIINPPQAAILAVGTTTRTPVVAEDGSLEAADVMTLTLSADHRPVDGALAARWFAALQESVEKPMRLLI
ncbi:dihydrolipoamide acetyltransferase family protein [Streptomyces sp. NPDC086777]|uniref:dihydrolipoamide acetyltransferase family protein n=1 Tax=Streptomyces sp. NPDC086777 TaxID=3154866 RepID=UPI00344EDE80